MPSLKIPFSSVPSFPIKIPSPLYNSFSKYPSYLSPSIYSNNPNFFFPSSNFPLNMSPFFYDIVPFKIFPSKNSPSYISPFNLYKLPVP